MKRARTYLSASFDAHRPITPVRIINPETKREVVVSALWDTGADVSVILKSTADFLGLYRSASECEAASVGGKFTGRTAAALALPGDDGRAILVYPFEAESLTRGIDFIIGMDIIKEGDFTLTFRNGQLLIAYTFGEKFLSHF